MWKSLSRNAKSQRSEIVFNLDQDNLCGLWFAVIGSNNYKLIWGQDKLLKQDQYEKFCNVELFNIKTDLHERNNLASELRNKVAELKDRMMFRIVELTPTMYSAMYSRDAKSGWLGYFEEQNKKNFYWFYIFVVIGNVYYFNLFMMCL